MILTGKEIVEQIKQDAIHIKPFSADNINPNSYNYHLDDILFVIDSGVIDPKKKANYKEVKITSKGFVLEPGKLYLGNTFEEIGSQYYVTSLIGRSSVGRLGLFLQITADMGQLGAKHKWTLELKVVQPLRIYPRMKIGQISFWKVSGLNEVTYLGKYASISKPETSAIHMELN